MDWQADRIQLLQLISRAGTDPGLNPCETASRAGVASLHTSSQTRLLNTGLDPCGVQGLPGTLCALD